ncbi:MAG: type I phosphomannose isomerase catalytic subunit, partial [Oscillospiraceae bacterium]
MYPLKLKPAFKDYLWGGTKLRDVYGKDCSFDKVAESWELSCHKDGNSVIDNGEAKGMTLAEYIEKKGKAILGKNCERFENFPVLIKLIDAKDNLSVQVHPDNEYAMRVEGEYGKTEMWYIVDCDEGAELIYGFKGNVSKEEFAERIKNNTLLEITNSVPVKKGDVFFIRSGTLHAIGKGILIAEIQQNSNTTYRVYDYGRVGADGKTRPL